MAIGDILALDIQHDLGAVKYNVAAAATTINPGEPVQRALGATTVTAAATNTPVVGTSYYAGVAATTSTQTASVAGEVYVYPIVPGVRYTIEPTVAATWDTQSEYDALVGKRVLIDLTAGSYTILATDSANNGCVIAPLDVFQYPGRVAFSFRNGVSDLS